MRSLRSLLSASNLLALLALLVASAGTATAAGLLTGADIKDGTISAADLRPDSVGMSELDRRTELFVRGERDDEDGREVVPGLMIAGGCSGASDALDSCSQPRAVLLGTLPLSEMLHGDDERQELQPVGTLAVHATGTTTTFEHVTLELRRIGDYRLAGAASLDHEGSLLYRCRVELEGAAPTDLDCPASRRLRDDEDKRIAAVLVLPAVAGVEPTGSLTLAGTAFWTSAID